MLTRNARAEENKTWQHEDHQRPLSQAGWEQAHGLAANLLTLTEPSKLVASPYLRCTQTLTPLAGRCGRIIHISDLLTPDAAPVELGRYLAKNDNGLTAYCTHGETLTALLAWWATQGFRMLHNGKPVTGNHTENGAAWLVSLGADPAAYYIPPLLIDPALQTTG